jgi:ABC-type multidrug transport system fused ATPase/permease subunit
MNFINYSGGNKFLIQLAVTNIICQISQIYREYYLTTWSSLTNITKNENNTKIFCFILLKVLWIVAAYFRQIYMVKGFIKYNAKIYDTLIQKLLNVPINLFHDITPKGNILNRLNKQLDNSNILTLAVIWTIRVIAQLIGSIVVCYYLIYGLSHLLYF